MPIQFIMKRFEVVILFIACLLNSISAQDLPEQMFADPLSHIIYRPTTKQPDYTMIPNSVNSASISATLISGRS